MTVFVIIKLAWKRVFGIIVEKIGAAKVMLVTVASGSSLNATTIATSAMIPDKHLSKCKRGFFVLKKFLNLSLGIKKKIGINPKKPLKNNTCPTG